MNLKASFAVAAVALLTGAACSSASTPTPRAEPGVVTTQTTTPPTTAKAVSFASCAEAKAAGYQDIARGTPGYSTRLDADGDGVACVS